MKCKINGFWNTNGTGQDAETKRSFSWNNFCFSVSYLDKKQVHMIGEKSKTLKVKASELNHMLGLGLNQDEIINFSAEEFQRGYNVLGAVCIIDYDDDSNLIDFEILQEGKPLESSKNKS